ncbi:MAG TPA: TolC family protein [Phycisphaerales bacterium]|nr:TolC family protein [Phycisphaerales bacterium]
MRRRSCLALSLAAGLLLAGCAEGFDENAYERFAAERDYFADASSASRGVTTAPATQPAEPQLGETSQLRDYLAYAALHSPELESAFSAWKAALERIPQVKALPDPRFSYKYYVVEVMMRDGDMRHMLALSQEFPWPGKLELRGKVAAAEAQGAFHRFEAVRLKLFHLVQRAYAEYYYLRQATRITEQNIELLNQIESLARRRYTVGADSHPDVIRAQVEQGKLADRLRTLQKLRAPLAARLNAALNRPANAPLPWPRELPQPQSDFSDEQLLVWAAQANPEVRAMDREIAARRHGIDLAGKDYYPDIMLGVEYGVMVDAAGMPSRDMEDPVAVMVSMNIPIWWDKISAGVREARWRHLKAVSDKVALLNNLSADVEMALFEFQDAGRKINLYRDTLIPKAEQALQAAQTAYAAGKANFQDYLDAQRVLLEFQLSFERSQADRAQRLAELEMLVGKALPTSK